MDARSLQDGSDRTVLAAAVRGTLWLASGVYRAGRWGHRALYASGWKRRRRVPRPVLSVGNLTVGGVGKTPFVAELARRLQHRGLRPAVLARGYGSAAGARLNEEGLWLERAVPGLVVFQGRDRTKLAARAIEDDLADVFLLDDGFQHEPLHRDLDLVLIDATNPFGHDHCLPRGLLREPPTALARADWIGVTRVEQVSSERITAIEARIRSFAPDLGVGRVECRSSRVRIGEEHRELAALRGAAVEVVCAVGNPDSVRRSVELGGVEVAKLRAFPDHHRYRREEVDELQIAARSNKRLLVTTEKDAVKLEQLPTFAAEQWAVLLQTVKFVAGELALEEALERALVK